MSGDNHVSIGELAQTPIGDLWLAVDPKGVVAVNIRTTRDQFVQHVTSLTGHAVVEDPAQVADVAQQLRQYFDRQRQLFELPLNWEILTPFQQTVLKVVSSIPYGRLLTYNDVAHEIGQPRAVRAVGRANATNPIPIIIPCHRVIGSDGKLHGYASGLETKAQLLRLEGSWLL